MGRKSREERKKEEKQKLENNIVATANEIIAEKEKRLGRELTTKEIGRAFKKAEKIEKSKMRRLKIAKILAGLGLTAVIGGAVMGGLLPSGDGEPTEGTEIEETGSKPPKDDPFREGIRIDGETPSTEEEKEEDNIIDEILEAYNANLSEEEQISKENLGIIKQDSGTVGQIIADVSGNEVTYIKAPTSVYQLKEGQMYVDDQVNGGYYLVNTETGETIAGVIQLSDGSYCEIRADYVSNGDDEYTINPEAYIHFEELKAQLEKGENEEIDLDKIGKAFEGYYDYRVNNLTSENTRGDNGELEI